MKTSVALRFWTEAETFNLIEYVSHFPCLYDSQNAQYKNVLIKTQAKAKIANPNEAFTKWQLLKTRYCHVVNDHVM
ncbi:hypothetical protein OUZ56_010515 [Daphnia magna]|uniref:MADF domain-containing protein n=1 Tax=Daphnia magna TaxID=35525 RepID=A0ABR0AIQ4_9CRUS|nr:hypothetical protein OUZ56_010515 [Daphnia magna]